ncbi:MAG: hypothetical protein HY290_30610 [Planctomycetia bacterium]|nr:hypothetical protein [Planctomycetia bacterium]
MNAQIDAITYWLIETVLHGTVILAIAVAALALIRQPARRMPVVWGALIGLLVLAILPALSWWPRFEMRVWHNAASFLGQTQKRDLAETAFVTSNPGAIQNVEAKHGGIDTPPPQASETATRDGILSAGTDAISAASMEAGISVSQDRPQFFEPGIKATSSGPTTSEPAIVTSDFSVAVASWKMMTIGLWMSGALLTTVWVAIGAWRTHRLFRRAQESPDWIREELRRLVPPHRNEPRTRVSRLVASALACGAIRPVILLRDPPAKAADNDRKGIRAALAHEYAHIAHADLWFLALERLLLPLYFAHPLFWLLRRWIRRDQEILADAAAAGAAPFEYAEALLDWARLAPSTPGVGLFAALPLWNSPCHLRRRIEMLLDARNPIARRASRLWQGATLATVVGTVIGTSIITLQTTPGTARDVELATVASPSDPPTAQAGESAKQPTAESTPSTPPVSDPRPQSPAAAPGIRRTFFVDFEIELVHVDHRKLAQLNTSLSKLAADACIPIHESRTIEKIAGIHASADCSPKLIDALKACGATTTVERRKISMGIESGPKIYANPTKGRADGDLDFNHEFPYGRLSLRLEGKIAEPADGSVLYVKLSARGEQLPRAQQDRRATDLEVSSTRRVAYSSLLKVGQSLLIVDDSHDAEGELARDRVSLIVLSPTRIEQMPDSPSGTPSLPELESLRKTVEELKQEVRTLKSNQPQPRGAPDSPAPDQPSGGQSVNSSVRPTSEELPQAFVDIVIEGNRSFKVAQILAMIKTRKGQPTDSKQIKEDVRALMSSRQFVNVDTRIVTSSSGPVLVFRLQERVSTEKTVPGAAKENEFSPEQSLELQLLSAPPALSPVPLSNQAPPAEQKLTPELETILSAWEKAASSHQRVQLSFQRFTYDRRHGTETRAEGAVVAHSPQRAYYFLTPANVQGLRSKVIRNGKAYELRTEERALAWMWTETRVMHLDMQGKTYESAPLTAAGLAPAEADQFFLARPFLLGMPVSELLQRFVVGLDDSRRDGNVWLTLIPRTPAPSFPYRQATIVLSRTDWRPLALKLIDTTDEIESVHVFQALAPAHHTDSLRRKHLLDQPELSVLGFREILRSQDTHRPWQFPQGVEAVFRSGRAQFPELPSGKLDMSVVPATRLEIPSAFKDTIRGGMKVTTVVSGGVAAAAGIRPNDILIGLHSWETIRRADMDYAIDQFGKLSAADNSLRVNGLAVTLIRDGQVLKTQIHPTP